MTRYIFVYPNGEKGIYDEIEEMAFDCGMILQPGNGDHILDVREDGSIWSIPMEGQLVVDGEFVEETDEEYQVRKNAEQIRVGYVAEFPERSMVAFA